MPPLPCMGEPKDKRAAKTEGSYMDSKNQRESRPEELVIPLWEEAGPSCPMDRQRAAAEPGRVGPPRAGGNRSGTTLGCATPAITTKQPPEKMVRLWLESEK